MHHSAPPLLRRLTLLVALPVGAWAAPGLPAGLFDHTICCGPKPSMNAEDFVEAGYDPMLRRQHLLSPTAPPSAAAEPVKLPGADGLAPEILPSAPPTIPSLATSAPLTPIPPVAPRGPLIAPTEKVEGHLRVGFDVLAGYTFQMAKEDAVVAQAGEPAVAAKALGQIPEIVRKLDGQKVLLTGFMLPMKMEGPLATEFLLVANSMLCCYGVVPDMNQWVVVKMAKGGVKPQQDTPMQFFGTLRVQPRFDVGALSAIYHLDAERPRVAK